MKALKKTSLLLFGLFILFSCNNSVLIKPENYELINHIVAYQKHLTGKKEIWTHNDKITNNNDSLSYKEFKIFPRTSKSMGISNDKTNYHLTNKQGYIPGIMALDSFFTISDTSFIRSQLNKQKFETHIESKLSAKVIPQKEGIDTILSPQKVLELGTKYNTSILFIDKPIFSSDENTSAIATSYFSPPYTLLRIFKLKKSDQSNWEIIRVSGSLLKFEKDTIDGGDYIQNCGAVDLR